MEWPDGRRESVRGQQANCPRTAHWTTAYWRIGANKTTTPQWYQTKVHMDGDRLNPLELKGADIPPKFTCEYFGKNVAQGK